MAIEVHLGKNSYLIHHEIGALQNVVPYIEPHISGNKITIITDENVNAYYGKAVYNQLTRAGYRVKLIPLKPGEPTKSFYTLPDVYKELIAFGMTRADTILALGGGVIGDLAGFVAATFLRGIAFVQIPTSLLAQVDSSVGGKVAVDLSEGKNLVGQFYHPKVVIIDPLVLETLPKRYMVDGLGEVIKYGCIREISLYKALESYGGLAGAFLHMESIIGQCCACKAQIVERDVFDKGERMLLNFGHTIGHALEQYYNYERFSHGEAVSIGMYAITKVSEEKGLTQLGTAQRLQHVLEQYGLPWQLPIPLPALFEGMQRDKKKRGDTLTAIVLSKIGEAFLYPTTLSFFGSDKGNEV